VKPAAGKEALASPDELPLNLAPKGPAYLSALAFNLNQKGDKDEEVRTLEALLA